jgi:hypothetical protein
MAHSFGIMLRKIGGLYNKKYFGKSTMLGRLFPRRILGSRCQTYSMRGTIMIFKKGPRKLDGKWFTSSRKRTSNITRGKKEYGIIFQNGQWFWKGTPTRKWSCL